MVSPFIFDFEVYFLHTGPSAFVAAGGGEGREGLDAD